LEAVSILMTAKGAVILTTKSQASRMAELPAAVHENQRYSILEANAVLRQSNAKTYLDIRAGKIRIIKHGRRTYVPGSELIRLSRLPDIA
jgi:hypothetical protein